jgi:hypothetical protein
MNERAFQGAAFRSVDWELDDDILCDDAMHF